MIRNKSTHITEASAVRYQRISKRRQAHLLPNQSLTQVSESRSRPPSSSSRVPPNKILLAEGSQSTTSTVDIWLDDQPDQPEEYEFEHPQTSKKKRKRRAPDQTLSKHSHVHRQLMEVAGNNTKSVEQSPNRKLRSSTHRAPPTTPTRDGRSKQAAQQSITADIVIDPLDSLEEEGAPTPRPKALGETPSLQRRPQNPQFNTQTSESSESRDSTKSRSQSPTKHLGDFQFSDMPVDSRAWSTAAIPPELEDLVKDMTRIGHGIEIIPTAVKDRFVAIRETVHGFQWAKDDGRGKRAEKEPMDRMTGGLGHAMFWHQVSMIHRATAKCVAEGDPEPAWNSEVHSRVLRLALEGHWQTQEVWYKDITVARISNKSLVPWNIATGAMQSKMVDYAIVINPSQEFTGDPSKNLHNHIIEKLRFEKAGASINQTAAEWVRFRPIGVNVETKKGAVGEDEAHVQLGTWLTAQYSRLRQLMPGKVKTKLPSFPVLSVQGQRWLLMIACIRENGRIDLIKELHLGVTGTFMGVYQVIAAIRRIAQWVNDVYRPWFEREILGIKKGGPGK